MPRWGVSFSILQTQAGARASLDLDLGWLASGLWPKGLLRLEAVERPMGRSFSNNQNGAVLNDDGTRMSADIHR